MRRWKTKQLPVLENRLSCQDARERAIASAFFNLSSEENVETKTGVEHQMREGILVRAPGRARCS